MPKIQITIVPKQVGQILDEILDNLLDDVTLNPISHGNKPLQELIPYHYYSNYNVYQGQCYKQYSGNLCGYHATFNSLCCLNMYSNLKSQYVISSAASFWKFKKKVQNFLFQIKKMNKLEDKWPWRDNDIMHGDFQRTYNKLCIQMFDDFDVFRQNHQNFTYISHTWEFQYQNLIISQQSRLELNQKINYFKSYKEQKPLIFGIMLGITCHWTVLIAFKRNGKSEYWYFDSHNENQLNYTEQQIMKSIQKFDQQRIEMGKPKYSNFQRQKIAVSTRDSQIKCLQGKASIDQYSYNQLLNVFARPIEQATKTRDQKIVLATIKDYWYNIVPFFKNNLKWQLLTEESKKRIQFLIQIAQETRKTSNEGKSFYDLIKKHASPKSYF